MTSSLNPDPGHEQGGEPANQRPRDWRRRRRSERTTPETPAGQSEAPQPQSEAADEVLSQPLITLFEPAMNWIGSYSAPMVFAGIIGLVTGIVVVVFISSMHKYGMIDIYIGATLLGLVGAVFFSDVLAAFVSRTGRYGFNTLVLMGAFTGIIVVANVLSFENSSRMDFTATNQFSLANRTKDVLSNLTEDVQATAFYKDVDDPNITDADAEQRNARRNKVVNTLEEFDSRSSKFSFRIIDPDLQPGVVSKYFGARPAGFVTEIVVVEATDSGRFDALRPTDADYTKLEQDLVTSTLVATGSEKKQVYFLSGHGERNIDGETTDGYAAVREGLESDNYQVQELIWRSTDVDVEVPSDAALVVIAGPSSSLPEAHEAALDRYLEGVILVKNAPEELLDPELELDPLAEIARREHGRMIFLAEPDTPMSFRKFFADWGVLVSTGYIRDVGSSVPGLPHTLSLQSFNPNAPLEITLPKGERLQSVFMPGATAIDLLPHELVIVVLPLVATTANSFLIAEPDRTEPITDAGAESDRSGPFFPALLIRSVGQVGSQPPASTPEPSEISDIIVFGDSDFLSNSSYNQGGGSDLFLNSANFLVGDFSLVSIRPKDIAFREFNLDANEYDFVRFSSWLFLPGIMGLMAALVWWVRR